MIKKKMWIFFVVGLYILPVKAVQWPKEPSPFGVPGTDKALEAYSAYVLQKYPLSQVEDEENPTLNNMGTTMKTVSPFSLKFLEFAARSSLPVLSVGEGTGNVVLLALEKNITFVANDMDPRHLGYIYASTPQKSRQYLFLKRGKFPDQVNLPENSLGAIYFGRVFHFQTGKEIEKSLEKAYTLLKKGGKVYGRASSPFQKHLQFFLPTYYKRVAAGNPWPGICTDMQKGWPTLHQYLPPFMNLLDVKALSRALIKAGFEIEECAYTPINHPEFKLDGREGIGFIAVKR